MSRRYVAMIVIIFVAACGGDDAQSPSQDEGVGPLPRDAGPSRIDGAPVQADLGSRQDAAVDARVADDATPSMDANQPIADSGRADAEPLDMLADSALNR